MKVFSVGFALFVAGVLADTRISYTCYDKTYGVDGKGGIRQNAGGTVADDYGTTIIAEMGNWSSGKYSAKQGRSGIITVSCVNQAENQNDALNAIADQQSLVNANKPA